MLAYGTGNGISMEGASRLGEPQEVVARDFAQTCDTQFGATSISNARGLSLPTTRWPNHRGVSRRGQSSIGGFVSMSCVEPGVVVCLSGIVSMVGLAKWSLSGGVGFGDTSRFDVLSVTVCRAGCSTTLRAVDGVAIFCSGHCARVESSQAD